jgi:hypothetical protein
VKRVVHRELEALDEELEALDEKLDVIVGLVVKLESAAGMLVHWAQLELGRELGSLTELAPNQTPPGRCNIRHRPSHSSLA